ncbi:MULTISPECIES: hypothetical protein [unclassified Streptomyces]|uniref:hypothetical protein n=1 Tax=unclassified Streptomyces TaxID=2593676 RepID=UPI000698C9C1|nr:MULTISPECIES: hypothetical protein [unclassified Streptomyces]ODA74573.1 hypothetical protein APS67_001235 [Streptomyces sp. AVP053U2]
MTSNRSGAASRLDRYRALLDQGNASPTRARKAVRDLLLLPEGGEALELAARFARTAEYGSQALLRLWPAAADPDGFCAHLLAPALTREGLTELRLRRMTSLRGLRHLTMLRTLRVDRCTRLTDLTDVGALTGLTDLDLGGCPDGTSLRSAASRG